MIGLLFGWSVDSLICVCLLALLLISVVTYAAVAFQPLFAGTPCSVYGHVGVMMVLFDCRCMMHTVAIPFRIVLFEVHVPFRTGKRI